MPSYTFGDLGRLFGGRPGLQARIAARRTEPAGLCFFAPGKENGNPDVSP